MIKEIIQTWKTTDLSDANPLFQISSDSWKSQNPSWAYQLVDDAGLDFYVKTKMPRFHREVFKKYEAQIQRVDIFRVVYMLFNGGLYADLDAEAVRPFVLQGTSMSGIVLGSLANKESSQHLPNAFLYTGTKYCAFWAFVLAEAKKRFTQSKGYDGAEYLTGPALLTSMYYAYLELDSTAINSFVSNWLVEDISGLDLQFDVNFEILQPEVIYPIDWTTSSQEELNANLRFRIETGLPPKRFMKQDTVCINYWTHSWSIPKRGRLHALQSKLKTLNFWVQSRLS